MTTSFNSYTVQAPMANGTWLQCGNSRYMSRRVAEAVYQDCSEHIACAFFAIDPVTGEFEQYEIRRNF